MQVNLFNNHFTFNVNKTIYWQEADALLIADLHLGKSTHFRKNGMALPYYYAQEDIATLDNILTNTAAKKIYFLGDLFHSDHNKEWQDFKTVIEKQSTKTFKLIAGNHDVISVNHYEEINFKVQESYLYNDILLTHEPTITKDALNICGHIHPGVLLQKGGHKALRLPCFCLTKDSVLIMPALGATTGLMTIEEKKAKQIWIIANDKLVSF